MGTPAAAEKASSRPAPACWGLLLAVHCCQHAAWLRHWALGWFQQQQGHQDWGQQARRWAAWPLGPAAGWLPRQHCCTACPHAPRRRGQQRQQGQHSCRASSLAALQQRRLACVAACSEPSQGWQGQQVRPAWPLPLAVPHPHCLPSAVSALHKMHTRASRRSTAQGCQEFSVRSICLP